VQFHNALELLSTYLDQYSKRFVAAKILKIARCGEQTRSTIRIRSSGRKPGSALSHHHSEASPAPQRFYVANQKGQKPKGAVKKGENKMKKTIQSLVVLASVALFSAAVLVKTGRSQQAGSQQATAGATAQAVKTCIESKLPTRTTVTKVDSKDMTVTIKYAGLTVPPAIVDQIRKAVCSCQVRRYSVTGEDQVWPDRPILIIVADCNSGEFPVDLSKELLTVLSEGDGVTATIKEKTVTFTGTVTKQKTIEAVSQAAIKAGAKKVSNKLTVKMPPKKKK